MSQLIEVGSQAPNLTFEDAQGQQKSLEDLKGKKVLISSHPLAWTSVCLDQMRALERAAEDLQDKQVHILGFSVDPHPAKLAWFAATNIEHIDIVSDFEPKGEWSKALGLYNEEYGFSNRAQILLDEEGKVLWAKAYDMGEVPPVEDVLEQL